MATINAAAAKHVCTRGTFAALVILVAGGLTGCANGGGSLLQTNSSPLAVGTTQNSQPAATSRAKIVIAPLIGAPDSIAKQIVAQLNAESSKNNIAIAQSANEQVDYTLRGYIVAAREASGTKVSYIWDVTNPTGARVHRITGEEVVKGAGAGDPWAAVSPQVIQTIVAKTGQQLNTWMPQKAAAPQRPAEPVVGSAPTNRKPLANPTQVATNSGVTPGSSSISTAGINPPATVSSSQGSIGRPFTAVVPNVVGAPGDGATSLASALRNELLRNGVKPGPPGTSASYRVEGRVKMGPVEGGQQPIKIDWVVRDPKGTNLGTVSQENKIPAGSLNGRWGSTAAAAATAATQGIIKLLPKQTASR